MMACVIIDDEPLAVGLLQSHVAATPGLQLSASFTDAVEGKEYLMSHRTDLLFVDVQMPDLNGTDLVRSLIEPPLIIFTTAHEKYAIEGFQVDAVDYLLKPIDLVTFQKAVEKAKTRHALLAEPIFIKVDHAMVRLDLQDILYVEGWNEYVRIHRTTGKPYVTLLSLRWLEQKLPEKKFMRVHRSYIINLDKVTEVDGNSVQCGEGVTIPVSRQYKDRVQAHFDRSSLF